MPAKRIIPCLDVKEGRVVKGTNFVGLKDAGDAIELAALYSDSGADELVFLDITATLERRKTIFAFVEEVAKAISIPFTVGGGISELSDIEKLLRAGADKVSLNSSIVRNPGFITEAAYRFGSQAVVAAIDINLEGGQYPVYVSGGKKKTDFDGFIWCKEVENLGAGEILLTSMHCDGTRKGFDIDFLSRLQGEVNIPVIASGGAGNKQHFLDAFEKAGVDACLAAGLFHFGELAIPELKEFLRKNGVETRS
ncbi:MAG: imidazole glycerol phosphate synthase subunit HisF [Ignavibacteria bacterium]|nr:imidazole glycerol phosphate synthase subunit HisF [Ignavibacteria bacterium]